MRKRSAIEYDGWRGREKKSAIVFCEPGDENPLFEVALVYLRSMSDTGLTELKGIISTRAPVVFSARIACWLLSALDFTGPVQVGVGLVHETNPNPAHAEFVTAFNIMNACADQSHAEFHRQLATILQDKKRRTSQRVKVGRARVPDSCLTRTSVSLLIGCCPHPYAYRTPPTGGGRRMRFNSRLVIPWN